MLSSRLLLALLLLGGPGSLLGATSWDWQFNYGSVFDPKALDYVVEQANARRSSKEMVDFWIPAETDHEARITQRFAFPEIIQRAHLQIESIRVVNLSKTIHGSASLWASPDGLMWVRLQDMPRPDVPRVDYTYNSTLPGSVVGSTELWIQARLISSDWNDASQYLSFSKNVRTNSSFELKVAFSEEPAMTPPTKRQAGPRRAIAKATLLNGLLQNITVVDGGQGYSTPPVARVLGIDGVSGQLEATLTDGHVTGFKISEPDAIYREPVRLYISAPPFMAIPTIPGEKYQLHRSPDLSQWQHAGSPFTARKDHVIQEFEVDRDGRFYQLCHLSEYRPAE